jgi:tryptophan synthase alpha chain
VGFGISTPEQFAAVGEYAEAAVVGSALMQAIEKSPECSAVAVAQFINNLRSGKPQLLGTQLDASR